MAIDTVFLDAGGVLVFPNWERVASALAAYGIRTTAAALAAVEWRAKHEVDTRARGERDVIRGWLVFERVFALAGITGPATIAATLGDLQSYHAEFNLWEHVPRRRRAGPATPARKRPEAGRGLERQRPHPRRARAGRPRARTSTW